MIKLIRDCWTENDGTSYDAIRVLGSIGFIAFLGMAYLELIRNCKDFSLIEVASGIAIILGVFAGGVTMKSKSEK